MRAAILCGFIPAAFAQIAVVRPFASLGETAKLAESFESWNVVKPCEKDMATPVDLFLVYSRSLKENPEAAAAAEGVAAAFAAKAKPWHQCFRGIHLLQANLSIAEDVYQPEHSEDSADWVSGPNAVFRFMLRHFLGSKYKAFFLMEMDSMPKKADWLAQLEREVLDHPTAAIRGSAYRGDRWDHYLRHVDAALLKHINGNAMYFTSSPFLWWLSVQLHEEATTSLNAVPYDLRIAQLVVDAVEGRVGEGSRVWGDLHEGIYASDSRLIGNYANTLQNHSFDGGEYISHNSPANCFDEVEPGTLTLGAIYTDSESFDSLKESATTNHPFTHIIALQYSDSEPEVQEVNTVYTSARGTCRLTKHAATLPRTRALCEVAQLAQTKYFALMPSSYLIRPPVSVLMNGVKPLLPHVRADSGSCQEKKTCATTLAMAQEAFQVRLEHHYELHDMVFVTQSAREFCASPELSQPSMVSRAPSADDYMAWHLSKRNSTSLDYYEVDRTAKGWRSWMKLHKPQVTPQLLQLQPYLDARRLDDDNSTDGTCQDVTNNTECTNRNDCEVNTAGGCRDKVTTTIVTTTGAGVVSSAWTRMLSVIPFTACALAGMIGSQ